MSQSTTQIIEKRELQRLRGFEYKYNKLLAFSLKNRLKLKKIIDTNIYAGLLTELEDVLDSIDELKDKPKTTPTRGKPKRFIYSSEARASDSDSSDDDTNDPHRKQDISDPDTSDETTSKNATASKRKPICVLSYNIVPTGTVEYYGEGNDFYVDELKRTYKNIVFPVGRVSARRYKLHCDVFINKGFPHWMYYADTKHRVIGVEKVCYSDEDEDPDSNMPVNDLRDEFITHYLF
jgi:hypothetical protein